MFSQAEPTSLDLNLRLFGIPVRVNPMFWVVSLLMGWGVGDPIMILVWVYLCFVSILVHELGHALVAKHYGGCREVVLYAYGGYAVVEPVAARKMRNDIMISAAGPLAGFALYFAAITAAHVFHLVESEGHAQFLGMVEWINLYWGLVNLLPIWPLDGGHISARLFQYYSPERGLANALKLSIVTALGVVALFLSSGQGIGYGVMFFGFLAFESYQLLRG